MDSSNLKSNPFWRLVGELPKLKIFATMAKLRYFNYTDSTFVIKRKVGFEQMKDLCNG